MVIWYSHLLKNFPQFVVIHTVKGFRVVNEAEVDIFLEFSCFFYDPMYVRNLISGSSGLSKSSLNIWEFSVHVLLKPSLENFERYLPVCDMSAIVRQFEHSLALPFSGIRMKTDLFQSVATAEFSKCAGILSAALSQHHLSGFEIAGIPSLLLALFVVMIPKAHLTSDSRMSGSHCDYLGHEDLFCIVLPVFFYLFLISSVSVRSIPFLSFIVSFFAWNVPLVSPVFSKRSLVFPILLFSSISLHCSFKKTFLSFLAILWNSRFSWLYLPFPLAFCFSSFLSYL